MSSSHFKPNQNSKDMIKVAMAYTSVSTALNQNVSVNAKAKEPTKALPKTATALFFPIFFNVLNR